VSRRRHPALSIGRIGDQAAVELVERSGEPCQIVRLGVRGQVDVQGVVAVAMRLDRRAADQHERHAMTREHPEQRLTLRIYRTGVCRLSHAAILSSSL
jgi:hypothetical protein